MNNKVIIPIRAEAGLPVLNPWPRLFINITFLIFNNQTELYINVL